METKYHKKRDLLCHSIEIVSKDNDLLDIKEDGVLQCDLFGKNSIVLWQCMSFDEIRFSVWWGYKCDEMPTNMASMPSTKEELNKYLEVCCSGFLERKDGLWLQGKDQQGLCDCYCAKSAMADLSRIPEYNSSSIKNSVRFYFYHCIKRVPSGERFPGVLWPWAGSRRMSLKKGIWWLADSLCKGRIFILQNI